MEAYFVTGTDTDVGKTFVSCALLHAAQTAGRLAVGYKPVAAGAVRHFEDWASEDALALQAASSTGFALTEINPVCLREPAAPHIAAAIEHRSLNIPSLVAGFARLAARADLVLVEGAGGFCVPLDAHQDMADLACALGLPVILVVGMRLGCLNHALLTAEAIGRRGLILSGWVANTLDPMPWFGENLATLRDRLPAPLLGIVPRCPNGPSEAAGFVQLPGT